ncbi:DMT family transporter [Crassaminicella profunda]|uniref:DMT family transporter n=1 Tax=Crassaminicella profunda TaxID=1286698 RepID=UPI001CA7742D|nr:DMT family transporter [Crassaminicella profunda]QZY55449.1 DMT family transporter [Crassaminicella profunda]
MKKKSVLADFSLLMVAFVWGSTFAVIKDVLSEAQPLNMMGIRFILATIILSIMFHKKLKKTTKEAFKGGVIIGLFLFVAMATQTIGLLYTTASKQAFLTGTNVVMVPFLVWMLHKKRPDSYSFIGAFLAIIGIGFLTLDGSFSFSTFNKGDVLTLICAVFFACHIISIGYFAKDYDPVVLSIVQFGVTGILFSVAAMFFESFTLNVGPAVMKAIIYLALAGTAFAYTVQNVAQKYTSSSHAAIILCLESVFGSLLAVVLLGEVLTMKMLIGCVIIFVGIIITETKLEFIKKKNMDISL